MKKMTAIMLTAMTLLLATAMAVGAVDSVEVRGQVATGDFVWTPQNFAGFYYDIDDNIGTETLTTTITGWGALLFCEGAHHPNCVLFVMHSCSLAMRHTASST
jgi:hypothetical protein